MLLVVALGAVVATGCMRFNLGIVVHNAEEASADFRITLQPEFLALMGGEAALEELRQEILFEGFGDLLEVPLLGDAAGGDTDAPAPTAEIVGDPDGWRGVAVEQRIPTADLLGGGPGEPRIAPVGDGWRFSWRIPGDVFGDPAEMLEDDLFDTAAMAEPLEFTFSITLPGHLDRASTDDVTTVDGMTTARWQIDPLEPEAAQEMILVTTGESPGLGTGTIAGIIVGSIGVIALIWWWERRRPRSGGGTGPDADSVAASPAAEPSQG